MEKQQFNNLLANPALLNSKTVQQLKEVVEEFPSFQMAWFLYLKNLKQMKSPEFDVVLKRVAVRIPNRKLLYKFLNSNFHKKHKLQMGDIASPVYKLDDKGELANGDSLIDKFLSVKPGAIRQNMEDNKNLVTPDINKVVGNSNVENDEIVTETLADIYFQQKNFEKAEESYKKLSLKYPKKSVYFATRIKEIENLKNK